MALSSSTLLKVLVASSLFSASVLASDGSSSSSSNVSQNAVPNAIADGPLDMGKIQRYQSLLNPSKAKDRFKEPFQWNDIIAEWYPLNSVCPAKCSACAAGCNPICCVTPSARVSGGGSESDLNEPAVSKDPESFVPRFTGIGGRPRPISPFACPCACQPGCPRYIQAACCLTPPAIIRPHPPREEDGSQHPLHADADVDVGVDTQESTSTLHPLTRIWGKPNMPEACPCGCESTCPDYIQAVCCLTPGTSRKANTDSSSDASDDGAGGGHRSKSGQDTLAMVTSTASGDPVSVLAAVNLTVFDSFITTDMVLGLERASEITSDPDTQGHTITLGVVVIGRGGSTDSSVSQKKTTFLQQSFQVLDGSLLMEREQILLGLGFMARIGSVVVDKAFLAGLEDGLPIVTGTKMK